MRQAKIGDAIGLPHWCCVGLTAAAPSSSRLSRTRLGRWNRLVAVLGVLFALGSPGALVLSLTVGFFGVSEVIALTALIVIARRTAPRT